jgi:hypothetical protein
VEGPGLVHLAGLEGLRRLDLRQSRLTHEAVGPLARLGQLRELIVVNTPLTGEEWSVLQRMLPECSIPGRKPR